MLEHLDPETRNKIMYRYILAKYSDDFFVEANMLYKLAQEFNKRSLVMPDEMQEFVKERVLSLKEQLDRKRKKLMKLEQKKLQR